MVKHSFEDIQIRLISAKHVKHEIHLHMGELELMFVFPELTNELRNELRETYHARRIVNEVLNSIIDYQLYLLVDVS